MVVFLKPGIANVLNVLKGVKPVHVHHIFPKSSIKSFYQAILCWFSRLNIEDIDVMPSSPLLEVRSNKFRPIINP